MSAIKDFYIEAAELLIRTIHDVYSEGVGVDPDDCDWKHPTASNPFKEVESRFVAAAPITMGQRWEFMRTETEASHSKLFHDLFGTPGTVDNDTDSSAHSTFQYLCEFDADIDDILTVILENSMSV